MRWGLLGVRVGIILVNLVIAAIIVLSVLPLVSGGLRIDLPDRDLPEPTYDGDLVRFAIPVDVYNGGYFDIRDFTVRFEVGDEGRPIANHTSSPVDIVVGKTNRVNIEMELDLNSIPTEELQKLVFERTRLDLVVGMDASYTFGLFKASVHTNQTMDWNPLVSDFNVDTGGIQTVSNGTNIDFLVPYSFSTSDMIAGKTIGLQATLRNSTALLGTVEQTIALQSHNQGQLRFTVGQQAALWLMAHPEDLTIGTDVSYHGVSSHQDYIYHWGGSL